MPLHEVNGDFASPANMKPVGRVSRQEQSIYRRMSMCDGYFVDSEICMGCNQMDGDPVGFQYMPPHRPWYVDEKIQFDMGNRLE